MSKLRQRDGIREISKEFSIVGLNVRPKVAKRCFQLIEEVECDFAAGATRFAELCKVAVQRRESGGPVHNYVDEALLDRISVDIHGAAGSQHRFSPKTNIIGTACDLHTIEWWGSSELHSRSYDGAFPLSGPGPTTLWLCL